MCGVLVTIGERWSNDFEAALDTLTSRGPDDRGVWADGDVRLGHRRLSIIDLSHAGHQPMSTPDGRYHITFNGEIYNFTDLRRDLEAEGVAFTGHSDTEVLLHAVARWGVNETLPRLDGMFGFAVWDATKQTLIAARDRFGIKPLYYSTVDGMIVSSTLAPFWKLRDFPRKLHYPALRDYLAAQSVFTPDAILRDVHALPQGAVLRWSRKTGEKHVESFWDIPPAQPTDLTFDEIADRCDAALAESVRRQLVSDVPVGAFLSGGIDSSLMVYYMQQCSRQPVRTFSISFPGLEKYDEARYARLAAEQMGTQHVELSASEADFDTFRKLAAELDQPLADPALLPTMALSELTRQHVTVAISGDGGDELFGGYDRFLQTEDLWPDRRRHQLCRALLNMGLLPRQLFSKGLRGRDRVLWQRVRLGPWPRSRKAIEPLLSPDAYAQCDIDRTLHRWRDLTLRYGSGMGSDALMRSDLWTYLSDNCLVKTDRASMCSSLEVRVPILGNPVVDAVLPLHADLKMAGGLKPILKALAGRHIDPRVWDRPKHGFSVPLKRYFNTTWKSGCEQLISESRDIAPFINHAALQRQWDRTINGRGDARVTYTLLLLIEWLRTHPVTC